MATIVKNKKVKMQMGGMLSMLGGAKPAAAAPTKPMMKKGGKVVAKCGMKKGGTVKAKSKK
jgi:hypothetical protein